MATVTSLADSRFDWERVMRELSLVLPSDVWLVSLNATASPERDGERSSSSGSSGASSGASGLRAAAPGPALEISGCASGQEAVAGFVTALKDIDGVTRVGVQSSRARRRRAAPAPPAGDAGAGCGDDCRTRDFIAKFEIVVAFDAAPVPVTSGPPPRSPRRRRNRPDRNHEARRVAEMKLSATNRMIVAMVAVAVLCVAFWMLVLGAEARRRRASWAPRSSS